MASRWPLGWMAPDGPLRRLTVHEVELPGMWVMGEADFVLAQ